MYDPETIERELKVQGTMDPTDAFAQNNFKDFVINVQEIKVYLAVFAAQSTAKMVHTPGAYYSTNQGTAAYQGRVLAFIGDCRATKEPTPICLPTIKTWWD